MGNKIKVKESFFNIDIENYNDGKTLIFNTYSNALAKFDKESLSKFRNIESLEMDENAPEIANGFVVPIDKDEVNSYMKEVYAHAHKDTDKLHVVMVPTFSCNYRCKYCFESEVLSSKKRMDETTVNDTIQFIKDYIYIHGIKYLTVEWFGGEPLLCMDIIDKVSTELIGFCNACNVDYHARMISNCRFLTVDIVKKLRYDYKIKTIQVTLDGMNVKYAEMKGCKPQDFYKVVKVIDDVQKAGIPILITIRINSSKDNENDIKNLLYFLYEAMDINIRFYLAEVRDYFNNSNGLDSFFDFRKRMIDWISKHEKIYSHFLVQFPKHRLSSCKATSTEMLTIDYNGNIYQCPHMVDKYPKSGDIYNGIDETSEIRVKALNNKLPAECYRCKYLPVCLGNCFGDRELDKIGINCYDIKLNVVNDIKLYYTMNTKK